METTAIFSYHADMDDLLVVYDLKEKVADEELKQVWKDTLDSKKVQADGHFVIICIYYLESHAWW